MSKKITGNPRSSKAVKLTELQKVLLGGGMYHRRKKAPMGKAPRRKQEREL